MNKRVLWLSWYGLLLLCAILGFLPNPQGFWYVLCLIMSVLSFLPAGLLLKWANDRGDKGTMRLVRNISMGSLGLTVVLFCLNVLSALWPEVWGTVMYALLVIGSTPMVCGQHWVISLFGWACLMWAAISLLKKK